ncbi:hypothetical protein ACLOJK_004196, partial [Asimina triloba]
RPSGIKVHELVDDERQGFGNPRRMNIEGQEAGNTTRLEASNATEREIYNGASRVLQKTPRGEAKTS